jgi:5'-3' exonuclease
MGIQGFTKLFPAEREVKLKDLRGKHIAIDAMAEIHRCSLGCSKTNVLTDAEGRPTIHISAILLGVIFKLQSYGIHQYWVFDNKFVRNGNIEPLKELELKKRNQKRKKAEKKIDDLKAAILSIKKDELFSSDDEDDTPQSKIDSAQSKIDSAQSKIDTCQRGIEKYEKQCFKLKSYHIEDVQFMLDCLSIPWVMAPYRMNNVHSDPYEAEQFAAMLTMEPKYGISQIDYVMSPDADAILFGSRRIIKRERQKGKAAKFVEYNLDNMLQANNITLDDLIKIGLILGTDFAKKTPGIGVKSIFKKIPKSKLKNKEFVDGVRATFPDIQNIEEMALFQVVKLTTCQNEVLKKIFKKQMTDEEIAAIKWNNVGRVPFADEDGRARLLDWLSIVKGFNRARIERLLGKVLA